MRCQQHMPGVMQVILFQQDEPAKNRRVPEFSGSQIKIPIGDCQDRERTRGSGSYKGQRFVVSLSSWLCRFPPLMFQEIPEQTQTNIIAFAIYNLILIEKLSVGWAGQPSSITFRHHKRNEEKGL